MDEFHKWNPRYVWYALANGNTPEAQVEHDELEHPGGVMCGFMLWIEKHRREFFKKHKGDRSNTVMGDSIVDHGAWDRFLEEQAGIETREVRV